MTKPKAFIVPQGKLKKTVITQENRDRLNLMHSISKNTDGRVHFIDPAMKDKPSNGEATK